MPAPATTGGALMAYPTTVDTGVTSPWIVEASDINSGSASGTLVANTVYCYVFELLATTTFSGMRIHTGSTATGGTIDCGVYDSGGNQLTHSGATTVVASQSPQHVTFGSTLTLNPGRYIMACTPSNSTDTIFRNTGAGGGMARAYNATNAGSAGVLPATTGTLVVANNCVAMGLDVVGGAV